MKEAFEKLAEIRSGLPETAAARHDEDDFLTQKDLVQANRQVAQNRLRMVLAEAAELQQENLWEDILALFSPVEEKLPELLEAQLDVPVREKVAFAMGQLGRFDDAIAELTRCIELDPERFSLHSSLAYTAYNSLFAAKNREAFLSGRHRHDRIALAHRHFRQAQRLRPDGVTNFYREGMLFHKIEQKADQAVALFARAIQNWDTMTDEEKELRHQERKNFVKSLYQESATLLATGRFMPARKSLERCLAEDQSSNYLFMLHKYFALGKVEYNLGRLKEARDALLFAENCRRDREPADFVFELLARVYLAGGEPEKAVDVLEKIPEKFRRPYYRWTEADVCCALQKYDRAKTVLAASAERDRRSRHKSLIRLAKIEYLLGNFEAGARHAEAADRFFRQNWNNAYGIGLFWQALCLFRSGSTHKARELALELKAHFDRFPKLDKLLALVGTEKDDDTG